MTISEQDNLQQSLYTNPATETPPQAINPVQPYEVKGAVLQSNVVHLDKFSLERQYINIQGVNYEVVDTLKNISAFEQHMTDNDFAGAICQVLQGLQPDVVNNLRFKQIKYIIATIQVVLSGGDIETAYEKLSQTP